MWQAPPLIVCQPECFDLLRRHIFGDMHRNLFKTEFFRSLEPGMAADDHHIRIDNDRRTPAEFLNAGGDGINGFAIPPRISLIRVYVCDFYVLNQHDASLSAGVSALSLSVSVSA